MMNFTVNKVEKKSKPPPYSIDIHPIEYTLIYYPPKRCKKRI